MSVDYLHPIERDIHDQVQTLQSGLIAPRFTSNGRSFLWLVLRGGLLQLLTAGFYRFWFLTNIRRRLWSATSFDGDALEYTGRGRELLLGFLFAMAILAPLFLAYFVLGLEIERFKAFASLPLTLFLYLFGQYASYRARRYRLSRTVWRGVRFWMEKDAWKYAFLSTALFVRSVVTLWIANPWRVAALEQFKMRRTRYGHIQASFEGTGWGLFKSALPLLFSGLVALIAIFVVMARMAIAIQQSAPRPEIRGGALDYLSFGLFIGVASSALGGLSGRRMALVRERRPDRRGFVPKRGAEAQVYRPLLPVSRERGRDFGCDFGRRFGCLDSDCPWRPDAMVSQREQRAGPKRTGRTARAAVDRPDPGQLRRSLPFSRHFDWRRLPIFSPAPALARDHRDHDRPRDRIAE